MKIGQIVTPQDPVVIVKGGAAGGDVELLGRGAPHESLQFMRVMLDQTEMLSGEAETSTHVE